VALAVGLEHVYAATDGDASDERNGEPSQGLFHRRERCDERDSHLVSAQIAAPQEERGDSGCEERLALDRITPNAIVLAQDDPRLPTDFGQPCLVRGVGSEVVVVDLYRLTGRAQRIGYDPSAEGPVDEERPGFRQPLGSRS
jgi:hypothetical protein